MGIYVFRTEFLIDQLQRDDADPKSHHDFGKDIIPRLVRESKAVAHRLEISCVRSKPDAPPYWRDVGTVDAYFDANMDLTREEPDLDLYDADWPIWTYSEVTPPAKFVLDGGGYRGAAICSLVAGGSIIHGATVTNSLLFTRTRVQAGSQIDRSVVLPQCEIGKHVRLRNVVVDRGVQIPDNMVIGEDPLVDAQRFRRTDAGVCLVTKSMIDNLST
jgi:glucose-1-phosphate adenylyltransferase